MRDLWLEHVCLTKKFIIESVKNVDNSIIVNLLMANQENIGNLIKPYYGEVAGEELTRLLKEHITITADIVTIAMQHKSINYLVNTWEKNAKDISKFLSNVNSFIKYDDIYDMLTKHLRLTLHEVTSFIKVDFVEGCEIFHKQVIPQVVGMADILSDSIIKQFNIK